MSGQKNISQKKSKKDSIENVREYLNNENLSIKSIDAERPWGAFFVIDKVSTEIFINKFFPEIPKSQIFAYSKNIQPKILLVEPGQKLSWQYHSRRAEIWKIISGPVGVIQSSNDTENKMKELHANEIVQHGKNIRHRLVGLSSWGIVAEIWQHTDPNNPSDEDDIFRVKDTYGRQ